MAHYHVHTKHGVEGVNADWMTVNDTGDLLFFVDIEPDDPDDELDSDMIRGFAHDRWVEFEMVFDEDEHEHAAAAPESLN